MYFDSFSFKMQKRRIVEINKLSELIQNLDNDLRL